MSNVSNIHSFSAYQSQGKDKSVALAEQRMLVVRFKAKKDATEAARQSVFASVPVLQTAQVAERIADFMPYVVTMLEEVQNQIGRDIVEAGGNFVTTEQLSLDAIHAYMVQQAAGERLTSDVIRAWFDSELRDLLLVAFADKMGIGDNPTEEQTKKLEQITNVYRDKFATLAGGRTVIDVESRKKLVRALELADTSEGIGNKLIVKLQAMDKVSVEEFLGL